MLSALSQQRKKPADPLCPCQWRRFLSLSAGRSFPPWFHSWGFRSRSHTWMESPSEKLMGACDGFIGGTHTHLHRISSHDFLTKHIVNRTNAMLMAPSRFRCEQFLEERLASCVYFFTLDPRCEVNLLSWDVCTFPEKKLLWIETHDFSDKGFAKKHESFSCPDLVGSCPDWDWWFYFRI
jgi:hypothetical protein